MMHEIAHVLLGHISTEVAVETLDDTFGSDLDDDEVDANKRAARLVLPVPLPAAPQRVSAAWVEEVAAQCGVAPIVIIGQLQYRQVLDWRTTLARDAPTVTEVLATW